MSKKKDVVEEVELHKALQYVKDTTPYNTPCGKSAVDAYRMIRPTASTDLLKNPKGKVEITNVVIPKIPGSVIDVGISLSSPTLYGGHAATFFIFPNGWVHTVQTCIPVILQPLH